MAESQSSKLRKKWPWDWKKPEELTDEVIAQIVQNLYSYTIDVAYWYPTESGCWHWLDGLKVYCETSKGYFEKVAQEASEPLKPKLSAIAEEAFDLIDMFMELANYTINRHLTPPEVALKYNVPYSEEELHNKWNTIVRKLNLYMRSQAQKREQVDLTDTEKNILEALGSDTLHGPELYKKAGYDNSSHYRGIVSNLVKREILGKNELGYYAKNPQ